MTLNESLENLSLSILNLTSIDESSHKNGVVILQHAIIWKGTKKKCY